MKDLTLVILAAGMGSRFGGLKQIEPMGPNGEFIIDYSIYDALKAGFNKVVFIIKEENYEVFKETIGKRVEPHIHVEYAFQKNDNIPEGYHIPEEREKPLGTAHAFFCIRNIVKEPFLMINADDFYGRDAYIKASEFLSNLKTSDKEQYGMIGYLVKNTITEYGAVKRGVCEVLGDNLLKLTESKVERVDGKIIARPLSGAEPFEVDENQTVSMNMLLFTPSIFDYIEEVFPKYLERHKEELDTCEFLIPEVLFQSIEEGFSEVRVIPTTAEWYGVTFKEDVAGVKEAISQLVERGEYKNKLWD